MKVSRVARRKRRRGRRDQRKRVSLVGGRGRGGVVWYGGYIHGDSARCAVTVPGL